MLKDKYKFELAHQEAIALRQQIQKTFGEYDNAVELEVKLPLSVLKDFQVRLAGQLEFPKSKIKMHLKRSEALAFQVLYMGSMIESTHETMQLAHAIDTTL